MHTKTKTNSDKVLTESEAKELKCSTLPKQSVEKLISDAFYLYLQKFEECGLHWQDVVEAEILERLDTLEDFVEFQLREIEEISRDKGSDAWVYNKALLDVTTGDISLKKFIAIKETMDILFDD